MALTTPTYAIPYPSPPVNGVGGDPDDVPGDMARLANRVDVVLAGFAKKTIRIPHTFTISGPVLVPNGEVGYIPPFFVELPTNQTATLVAVRHRLHGVQGATAPSVTFSILRGSPDNGTVVGGLSAVVATLATTRTGATSQNVLADGDAVQLVVSAVTGNPQNMTVSVYLDVSA